ncbi:hypothetical protein CJH52_09575 [Salmonella enterica]|nr:hypothetical protein [Salmonella enterica subsp. enterica]EBC4960574.1 hypothetical protein [Salmonella enterica]EDV6209137.1 hypothetical protein [Salmonella enterica subsp. enterica serovar Mississippi]EBS7295140.1 hypothetical protein [Salmonella enterica]EBT2192436.1 hypothetical protein [Salmonella enterica]
MIRVAGRRRVSDKFVGNEFAQPKAASGEGQGWPSVIPGSIANYVTGVSERSQRTCGEDHDAKITLLHPTRLAESPPEFFHWMR